MDIKVERSYRHKKRGSTYEIVATHVSLQTSRALEDGEMLVVYVGRDGQVWARPYDEFVDGRFEDVGPAREDHDEQS